MKPLKVSRFRDGAGDHIQVWCAHGPCQSQACNDGAIADTEDEAVAQLEQAYEKENENTGEGLE